MIVVYVKVMEKQHIIMIQMVTEHLLVILKLIFAHTIIHLDGILIVMNMKMKIVFQMYMMIVVYVIPVQVIQV